VTYHQGRAVEAIKHFCESIILLRKLGDLRGIADCIEGLALIAVGHEQLRRGAYLYGAAEALREQIGAPLPLADSVPHHQALATLKSLVDPVSFTAAWENGRTIPLAQTLAFALADSEELPGEA
jgi:hypothetical protein